MAKERAIELQLIKPVVPGSSGAKGKITLKNLFKIYLKDLNVGFYDPCCDDAATCPPISQDPGNGLECRDDGLFANGGGGSGLTEVSTQDSDTVLFTGNGTIGDPLEANVALAAQPDIDNYSELLNIAAWGDSLTAAGYYESRFSELSGRYVYNGGVGGDTSTQIATRMLAATDKHNWTTIIWAGRNNSGTPATVLADIANMVAALGHNNYLVLSVLNGAGEGIGNGTYNNIISINNSLSSTYGTRYLDVRSYLVSQYDPLIPQDVTDNADDIVPSSLRSDNIHLTPHGYELVGEYIYNQKLAILTPAPPTGLLTAEDVFSLFNNKIPASFVSGLSVLNPVTGVPVFTTDANSYQSTFAQNSTGPQIGPETVTNGGFNTFTGWTGGGTDWTNPGTNKAQHVTGNTTVLTQNVTLNSSSTYIISFTLADRTTGNVQISVGGIPIYASGAQTTFDTLQGLINRSFITSTGGSLAITITPSSDYNGSITNITIKQLISRAIPIIKFDDLNGTIKYQLFVREKSVAFGTNGLTQETAGQENTGFGYNTLNNVTTGSNNTAFGSAALFVLTNGSNNAAFGRGALASNTTGDQNTALGANALLGNTQGRFNTAVGQSSGSSITTGISNVLVGGSAFGFLTTGNSNTAIGYQAGLGTAPFAVSNNVIIGYRTGVAMIAGASNNTLIGYQAGDNLTSGNTNIVLGYNLDVQSPTASGQLTIGNAIFGTGITGTVTSLSANAKIGINVVAPTAQLHLPASTTAVGTAPLKFNSGTLMSTAETGAMEYDGAQLYFTPTGTTRRILPVLENTYTSERVVFTTATGFNISTSLRYSDTSTSLGIVAAPSSSAYLVIAAGSTTRAPLRITSGTVMTTPINGSFEYDGTNLFFTRTGTIRETILTGNSGATAPATSVGGTITNRYGGDTNFLGDPNSWTSVVIGGTTYKIPLYT